MLTRALLMCGLMAATLMTAGQAQAYDLDNGRLKSSSCTACHGTNGQPRAGGFGSLRKKSYSYIYSKLNSYAAKFNAESKACNTQNPNACLMGIHAQPYSAQDLQDIAYYLSRR